PGTRQCFSFYNGCEVMRHGWVSYPPRNAGDLRGADNGARSLSRPISVRNLMARPGHRLGTGRFTCACTSCDREGHTNPKRKRGNLRARTPPSLTLRASVLRRGNVRVRKPRSLRLRVSVCDVILNLT